MHAIRDREREGIHTIARKGATVDKQTKYIFFFLSGNGKWHTDRSVVVGKYTQTRQKWLRAKIVKSDHGRHYKEVLVVYRKRTT